MAVKVSLSFARLPDAELDAFSTRVHDGLNGNAAFPTPPISLATMATDTTNFSNAVAAAQTGGPPETAAKNARRQAVLYCLRQNAQYVQMTADGDLEMLLSSGYDAQSQDRQTHIVEKPTGVTIKNGDEGVLIAKVDPVKGTNLYEGRCQADGAPEPMEPVFTGDSQHIIFEGLTPGALYKIQVRSLGGANNQSAWSDPVQHRSL